MSKKTYDNMFQKVESHMAIYESGDFSEYEDDMGWSIPFQRLAINVENLQGLEEFGDSKMDFEASLHVWKALHNLPPSLACEGRIWARLTHIECLSYTKKRWIDNYSGNKAVENIQKHFFSRGRTGYRDDNGIGRLWWNGYIAKLIDPVNHSDALKAILKSTDYRQSFVERPDLTNRLPVSRGILRAMKNDPWIVENEKNFRQFMVTINRLGSGIVFEMWSEQKVDDFMRMCSERTQRLMAV